MTPAVDESTYHELENTEAEHLERYADMTTIVKPVQHTNTQTAGIKHTQTNRPHRSQFG